MQTET